MIKTLIVALMLGMVALTGACAPAATPAPTAGARSQPALPPSGFQPQAAATAAPPGSAAGGGSGKGADSNALPDAAASERMIVYNTSLTLEVADTEKVQDQVRMIVAAQKGYISGSNLARSSNNKLSGTVTLRVPAPTLDTTLSQIKALGIKVLSEKKDSNDVTDQYTDLDARRKSLEATEQELLKLLATVRERSNKADEILAVYRELTNIRTQIEQIRGRQIVLENTSALATVTVSLIPHEDVQVIEPDQWDPGRVAANSLKQLVQALQGLANVGITLGLLVIPMLLVSLLPLLLAVLFVRWLVRRSRKVKVVPA